MREAFSLSTPVAVDPEGTLEAIYDSFCVLKSPLGYAPIREVLLLAGTTALSAGQGCFDISDGLGILRTLQRNRPDVLLFNEDRWGNMMFVKFIKNPLE